MDACEADSEIFAQMVSRARTPRGRIVPYLQIHISDRSWTPARGGKLDRMPATSKPIDSTDIYIWGEQWGLNVILDPSLLKSGSRGGISHKIGTSGHARRATDGDGYDPDVNLDLSDVIPDRETFEHFLY